MFGPLTLIGRDPLVFVLLVVTFLMGVMLRGVVQAHVAARLGDDSARQEGYGVPEPSVHFDVVGAALYVLLGVALSRPVPLTLRGRRAVYALVSGPLTLLVWALLLLVLQRAQQNAFAGADVLGQALGLAAYASTLHAVFYLLPLPHLDGGRLVFLAGPRGARRALAHLEGPGVLVTYIVWVVLYLSNVLVQVAAPLWAGLQWLISRLPW
ncbi:hypothetical protein [Deinococcus maricopensis]|uniref:Peptidase M50 n=1 Tax=Deinococcus maricopensis (strain DSM 21211 / LMG 22137 / NRRL B-23946 / LB-34) TaxID=709986 RepID=E8U792_DEIML|nr:hypothetical protein [Deinococcus maricopensis]ADV66931.1 hypothetical protein Deima_1280 [Deinococcus maricopensis DSM 21211]